MGMGEQADFFSGDGGKFIRFQNIDAEQNRGQFFGGWSNRYGAGPTDSWGR